MTKLQEFINQRQAVSPSQKIRRHTAAEKVPEGVKVLLLTDREVAAIINTSRTSVWRYYNEGLLPAPIKIGKSARWRSDEIMKCIAAATNRRDA